MWRGSRNNDQKPNRNRSSTERLGARRRERLMTRSCCFMSRLSATTARAPPGPRSWAAVVNRWARSISRPLMAEQGRDDCLQEQDCPNFRFQMIIRNSPCTGLAGDNWFYNCKYPSGSRLVNSMILLISACSNQGFTD